MLIELDLSPLERIVVVAARGLVSGKDFGCAAEKLATANVPDYGRIIDVSRAIADLSKEQAEGIAALMRGSPGAAHPCPVAIVVHPDRVGFARAVTELADGERPVKLCHTRQQAHRWLRRQLATAAH